MVLHPRFPCNGVCKKQEQQCVKPACSNGIGYVFLSHLLTLFLSFSLPHCLTLTSSLSHSLSLSFSVSVSFYFSLWLSFSLCLCLFLFLSLSRLFYFGFSFFIFLSLSLSLSFFVSVAFSFFRLFYFAFSLFNIFHLLSLSLTRIQSPALFRDFSPSRPVILLKKFSFYVMRKRFI